MGIAAAVLLITLGAVLGFGDWPPTTLDLDLAGWVLMSSGAVLAVFTALGRDRRHPAAIDYTVIDERHGPRVWNLAHTTVDVPPFYARGRPDQR